MLNGKGIADAELLNVLADFGPLAISEVVTHLEVTRTAVHERLLRLMAEGLVDRCVLRGGRGRPSYRYTVSHKARKLAGNNFADLAEDNATESRTYMKMALGGLGFGLGVKDYRVVMLFKDKATVTQFIESGWDFGAHADAAAVAGESGAEASGEGNINAGIEVFSMTEAGLALQATVTGTKYWKDDSLN